MAVQELLVGSEWTWGDGRIHLRAEGHLVAKWGETLLDGAGLWEAARCSFCPQLHLCGVLGGMGTFSVGRW